MRGIRVLFGVLALATSATVALAGGATAENTQKTIQELKQRLMTLEREVARQKEDKTVQQKETRKLIEEIKADAASQPALPKWLDDLEFSGDLRLRYQGECFSGRNTKNRNRARFRLRFGFKKTWLDDQMEVGFLREDMRSRPVAAGSSSRRAQQAGIAMSA